MTSFYASCFAFYRLISPSCMSLRRILTKVLSLAASRGSSLPSADDQLGETEHQTTTVLKAGGVCEIFFFLNMTGGSYSSLLSALPKISHFKASVSTASSCNTEKELHVRRHQTRTSHRAARRWKQEVTSSMYSSRSRAFLKSYSLARLLSSQMYSCREEDRKK